MREGAVIGRSCRDQLENYDGVSIPVQTHAQLLISHTIMKAEGKKSRMNSYGTIELYFFECGACNTYLISIGTGENDIYWTLALCFVTQQLLFHVFFHFHFTAIRTDG